MQQILICDFVFAKYLVYPFIQATSGDAGAFTVQFLLSTAGF